MSKLNRHFAIRQIITHKVVGNQDDLRRLLEEEGFETTQATLSRDLKELGVARAHTAEGVRYVLTAAGEENRLASLLSVEIGTIEANETLIVIKTLPGRAQGVAEILDSFRHPDVLGTLAGDNTIFIAPVSVTRIESLLHDLRRFVMGMKD